MHTAFFFGGGGGYELLIQLKYSIDNTLIKKKNNRKCLAGSW